jgi:hypothetical protein
VARAFGGLRHDAQVPLNSSSEIDAAGRRVNAALRQRFAAAAGVALLDENVLRADVAGDYRDTLHFSAQGYSKLQAAALSAIGAL